MSDLKRLLNYKSPALHRARRGISVYLITTYIYIVMMTIGQ